MKCKRTSVTVVKHDHGALQVMRQQAVKAIREGQDVSSVAAAYGINVRSVFLLAGGLCRWGAERPAGQADPGASAEGSCVRDE